MQYSVLLTHTHTHTQQSFEHFLGMQCTSPLFNLRPKNNTPTPSACGQAPPPTLCHRIHAQCVVLHVPDAAEKRLPDNGGPAAGGLSEPLASVLCAFLLIKMAAAALAC